MDQGNKIVSQWATLNHSVVFLKWLATGLIGISSILSFVVIYQELESPTVITLDQERKTFHKGNKTDAPINESDVREFVEDFLGLLNKWDQFVPDIIIRNIDPFVTEGLKKKLNDLYKGKLQEEFKGKTIKQDIANVIVTVTDKLVAATFDKVLRINEIPIVIPTELSFDVIVDTPTEWNPRGLFINGITEHKGE